MPRWLLILQLACSVSLLATATEVLSQAPNPAIEYARAEDLIHGHQWDAGIAALQPLLKSDPSNPKILNLAGLAFAGKGEANHAMEYFEAALKTAPNFTPALKNLAIEETSLGRTSAAEKHLQTALQQSPGDPIVNLYLAEILYEKGEFRAAADHFRKGGTLIARDPNMVANFAISEFKTGEQEKALRDLEAVQPEALNGSSALVVGVELAKADLCANALPFLLQAQTLSPRDTDIAYDAGICYLSLKQDSEAIGVLQKLIDQGHETPELDSAIAEAYEGDHQTQRAVDALRRAIAMSPDDDDNYLNFATICLDHQDFQAAEKVISVGLGRHPRSARLVFERGILNAMQDHYEAAERDFQLSADLAPESETGYIGLGVTYLETGKAAEAVPVLRRRLQEHPDDANLNYLLAEALVRSGTQPGEPAFLEAQTRLQKSTQINPKLVEPHVSLGSLYLRQEKVQEAVEQFELARKIDPNSKAACAHLAVGYRRLGETDKARSVLLELKAINDRERGGAKELNRPPGQVADTKTRPPSS